LISKDKLQQHQIFIYTIKLKDT